MRTEHDDHSSVDANEMNAIFQINLMSRWEINQPIWNKIPSRNFTDELMQLKLRCISRSHFDAER